ncbi:MAG: TorF family putative porin [Planctomycetota bacterium]|jgi:hypothetical protein
MKHKGIYLAVVILLGATALAQAQEGELSATIDVTYLSKYIWRGFDIYGDKGAIQSSIDVDLYGTGFGVKTFWTTSAGSGNGLVGMPNHELERLDLTLYYNNTLYEGETYATNYTVGWMYYNHIDTSRDYDLQEAFASFSWPEICPAGVVPSYTIIRMWPSKSQSDLNSDLSALGRGGAGGWLHIFGLGYDLPIADITPEEHIVHLSADFVYNDGVLGADHDWSHMVLGASTDFDLGNNLTFTPGLYHQVSMDDSVNDEEETWVSLSMKYAF